MRKFIVVLTLMLIHMKSSAQSDTTSFMEYQDIYSVYIVKDLRTTRDFYVKWLDFDVVFEASWFVYMHSKGARKLSFALIDKTHPSSPPAYGAFNGNGSFLTLQVQDASAAYERLKKKNAPFTYPLTKEAWGQVRFGLTDPNGLYIDIVQQIEPASGYWDQYLLKE
jgi:uncharacterized glyoxalase superfamily protein PhnB